MVHQDPSLAVPADFEPEILPHVPPDARPTLQSESETGSELLTADEVIAMLRLEKLAPRNPREALRGLVRRGHLGCLRAGPGKTTRMIFLRRHVYDCLAQWERWGARPEPLA